jgi:lactoylglutathione lyase
MSAKPFKILGIQQIAIGGPDKARLKSLWVDMFGLSVKSTFVSERENVDEDICALGSGPTAVEVDLMQPWTRRRSRPCMPRRSITWACGWTTCPRRSSG